MFCSFCGTETTQGLNYCKRCGSSLAAPAQAELQVVRPNISTGTAWAVGVTTAMLALVGLAIILGAMSDLVHNLPSDAVAFIMVCGSVTVLGSVFMLMRFWMRLLAGTKHSDLAALVATARAAKELGPTRMSALPDTPPPPPVSSVTENTTRTLKARMRDEG
jgi:hypothetical protein